MNDKRYKEISIKEFTKAASVYETNQACVYKMCKKDYPDLQDFFNSVYRVLKPV